MNGITVGHLMNVLGFEIDEQSMQNAENGLLGLKNTATKLLGAIGIGLSLTGIKNAIQETVTLSSEVEEMQNKFNVVFDGMNETVEEWAQNYADSIGRNKNDIKEYLADIQNLMVGFMGQDKRQEAYELTQAMTTLALDLASFNNIEESYAVNSMTKAIMGETEAAKNLGAVLNDVTRADAMNSLGLKGKYEALDQATKMLVNYNAILNQSPDAIGDCERSLNSYRSTLIAYESKLKEIKTIVGQFFMPVAQKIISVGTKGLTVVRDMVQGINDFADSVGGAEQILAVLLPMLTYLLIGTNISKLQTLAQGVSKVFTLLFNPLSTKILLIAAAILAVSLVIQDFITFLTGGESIIGDVFAKLGISAEDVKSFFIGAWGDIKDFLLDVWSIIQQLGQDVFGELLEWWEANGAGFLESAKGVWNFIRELVVTQIEIVAAIVRGVCTLLMAFWDAWGDEILAVFSAVWTTLLSLITPLLDGLKAIVDFLNSVFVGDWAGAWQAVQDFAAAAVEFLKALLLGIVDIFAATFELVLGWFEGIFEYLATLPERAMEWGKNIIQGLIDGLLSKLEGVKNIAGEIGGFFSDLFGFGDDDPNSPQGPSPSGVLQSTANGLAVASSANFVSPATLSNATGTSAGNRNITQNIEINNEFNGDQAGQEKSHVAMEKASNDATSEMARALTYTR